MLRVSGQPVVGARLIDVEGHVNGKRIGSGVGRVVNIVFIKSEVAPIAQGGGNLLTLSLKHVAVEEVPLFE